MPIRDERSLEEANRDDRPDEVGRLLREREDLEGEMVVAEAWGVVVRATDLGSAAHGDSRKHATGAGNE